VDPGMCDSFLYSLSLAHNRLNKSLMKTMNKWLNEWYLYIYIFTSIRLPGYILHICKNKLLHLVEAHFYLTYLYKQKVSPFILKGSLIVL
jgi:hypothetical protein